MHTYEVLFRENQFYSRCSVWNPGVVWCDIVGKSSKYTSVVTTVAMVDEIISNIHSQEELLSICQNRSVFSTEELKGFWRDIVGKSAKYTYCNHTECWESFYEKKYYDQNLSSFLLKLVLLSRFQFLLHIQ